MADRDALQVLAPEVRTLARPGSASLLAARGVINRHPGLRAVFIQARAEGWGEDRLADAIEAPLREALESTPSEARQAAVYLAAEYVQFGDTLLLISRETGRALARITDEDIWEPSPVPRESGGLAKPLPRLRPELEGFLYEYAHDHNREAQLQAALAVRTRQTAFLAAEGDRRLLVATRDGRKAIVEQIQARGESLVEDATGVVRAFLQHFRSEPLAGMEHVLSGVALARTRTLVSDTLAFNYRYDHVAGQSAGLLHGWAREVARGLSVEAHRRSSPGSALGFEDVDGASLQGTSFWVCDPAVYPAFARIPGVTVFMVAGASPIGFRSQPVGALVREPGTFRIEGREMLDRWDVAGRFGYDLHMDWSQVVTLNVTGCPIEALPA